MKSSRQKVEGENVSRYLESLAERVACSGEVLNINEHECSEGIVDSGINSLLAMPIRNKNDQIIGELKLRLLDEHERRRKISFQF